MHDSRRILIQGAWANLDVSAKGYVWISWSGQRHLEDWHADWPARGELEPAAFRAYMEILERDAISRMRKAAKAHG